MKGNCQPRYNHEERPFCWDVEPCSPTVACLGNNFCSRGYTTSKCAQCCDVPHDGEANCAQLTTANGNRVGTDSNLVEPNKTQVDT